ncbi:MAG: hypothetical protein ACI841_001530 [Planctomycetota bacterium]|jgi:hypothetical protein
MQLSDRINEEIEECTLRGRQHTFCLLRQAARSTLVPIPIKNVPRVRPQEQKGGTPHQD